MGNPVFRFRLVHPESGRQMEISEPDGWIKSILKLTRDTEFHTLVEWYDSPFIYYGNDGSVDGGVNFIRQIESEFGFDTELIQDIDFAADGVNFEDLYTGLFDFTKNEETNRNRIKSALIRNDFWSTFFNRLDTPVDIMSHTDLDDGQVTVHPKVDINLISQVLQMSFDGTSTSMGRDLVNDDYLQMSWDKVDIEEFDEYYLLPQVSNSDIPAENFAVEYAGEYRFIIQTNIWDTDNPTGPGRDDEYYPVININGTEYPFTEIVQPYTDDDATYINSDYREFEIDHTAYLNSGSLVKIYFRRYTLGSGSIPDPDQELRWNGNFQANGVVFPTIYTFQARAQIIAQTTYPNTVSDSFLLHDVGGQIADRIIGQNQTFYSEHLGGTGTIYRQYPSDGCEWNNILVKGLQLRQYTLDEKPFFLSFKQWWDGANPIFNLALGYDTVAGVEVIKVTKKEDAYNPTISTYFDYVHNIVRRYDNEVIFNKVDIGYKKWESENISGIDDPQTKHTYASRLKKSGKPITIESEFIAASLAIETTRRKTRLKSEDYKLDNDTFIIAISDTPLSPDRFIPETTENYSSVTNLNNSTSRYNIDLTPARNLIRWSNWLQGCLQHYIGSFFKFVRGEGNYDMTSDLISDACDGYAENLSEKQNIVVTDDYLHLPELFEITLDMSWEKYKSIRNNRDKAIGISQTNENHTAFFIKELSYEMCASRAVIQAWPKTPFSITNTPYVKPEEPCYEIPVAAACENPYETDSGENFTTETGECLEIE
jgi:hypothetical protein